MLEISNEVLGLLLAAGLLLLICVFIFLLIVLNRVKRAEEKQAENKARLQEDMRRLSDQIYSLPQREEINQQFFNEVSQLTDRINELGNDVDRRMEALNQSQTARIESMTHSQAARMDAMDMKLDRFGTAQETRLDHVSKTLEEKLAGNEQRMEEMRKTVETGMQALQKENAEKLDEMRRTVDEKLHATLDKRLGESFSLVNERLEQVYKGLGEMQTLAGGVGDLKKVLTNVKTRGIWGEMQLGNILHQMLAPSQFAENIELVPGSGKRVEYAVVMPGSRDEKVYLPIDSKFPVEDYERLLAAYESGDANEVKRCQNALENAFKEEGKRIAGKYIAPPQTTDFAIMFVPVEGLYAEALQRRGLIEYLQNSLRIVVAGPTTLTALLTSLQVGFKTLAIEKRSGEVWQLLGAVKGEFGRFTELLETTQKRINSVSTSLEDAAKKSRTIQRRLKDVEALESGDAARLTEDGVMHLFSGDENE